MPRCITSSNFMTIHRSYLQLMWLEKCHVTDSSWNTTDMIQSVGLLPKWIDTSVHIISCRTLNKYSSVHNKTKLMIASSSPSLSSIMLTHSYAIISITMTKNATSNTAISKILATTNVFLGLMQLETSATSKPLECEGHFSVVSMYTLASW